MAEKDAALWEKKLNICTAAAAYERDDSNHSRYEATSYAVLQRLAELGEITREDVLVDYGCGKGRVGFFLNHACGCRTIGVEYNPALYEAAKQNLRSYAGRDGVSFECISAEDYLPEEASCFYFFNPFSVKILRSVLGRIMESWYIHPRRLRLYFYYALDETLSLLMTDSRLRFSLEIDCRDLFHNDDARERILVFEVER